MLRKYVVPVVDSLVVRPSRVIVFYSGSMGVTSMYERCSPALGDVFHDHFFDAVWLVERDDDFVDLEDEKHHEALGDWLTEFTFSADVPSYRLGLDAARVGLRDDSIVREWEALLDVRTGAGYDRLLRGLVVNRVDGASKVRVYGLKVVKLIATVIGLVVPALFVCFVNSSGMAVILLVCSVLRFVEFVYSQSLMITILLVSALQGFSFKSISTWTTGKPNLLSYVSSFYPVDVAVWRKFQAASITSFGARWYLIFGAVVFLQVLFIANLMSFFLIKAGDYSVSGVVKRRQYGLSRDYRPSRIWVGSRQFARRAHGQGQYVKVALRANTVRPEWSFRFVVGQQRPVRRSFADTLNSLISGTGVRRAANLFSFGSIVQDGSENAWKVVEYARKSRSNGALTPFRFGGYVSGGPVDVGVYDSLTELVENDLVFPTKVEYALVKPTLLGNEEASIREYDDVSYRAEYPAEFGSFLYRNAVRARSAVYFHFEDVAVLDMLPFTSNPRFSAQPSGLVPLNRLGVNFNRYRGLSDRFRESGGYVLADYASRKHFSSLYGNLAVYFFGNVGSFFLDAPAGLAYAEQYRRVGGIWRLRSVLLGNRASSTRLFAPRKPLLPLQNGGQAVTGFTRKRWSKRFRKTTRFRRQLEVWLLRRSREQRVLPVAVRNLVVEQTSSFRSTTSRRVGDEKKLGYAGDVVLETAAAPFSGYFKARVSKMAVRTGASSLAGVDGLDYGSLRGYSDAVLFSDSMYGRGYAHFDGVFGYGRHWRTRALRLWGRDNVGADVERRYRGFSLTLRELLGFKQNVRFLRRLVRYKLRQRGERLMFGSWKVGSIVPTFSFADRFNEYIASVRRIKFNRNLFSLYESVVCLSGFSYLDSSVEGLAGRYSDYAVLPFRHVFSRTFQALMQDSLLVKNVLFDERLPMTVERGGVEGRNIRSLVRHYELSLRAKFKYYRYTRRLPGLKLHKIKKKKQLKFTKSPVVRRSARRTRLYADRPAAGLYRTVVGNFRFGRGGRFLPKNKRFSVRDTSWRVRRFVRYLYGEARYGRGCRLSRPTGLSRFTRNAFGNVGWRQTRDAFILFPAQESNFNEPYAVRRSRNLRLKFKKRELRTSVPGLRRRYSAVPFVGRVRMKKKTGRQGRMVRHFGFHKKSILQDSRRFGKLPSVRYRLGLTGKQFFRQLGYLSSRSTGLLVLRSSSRRDLFALKRFLNSRRAEQFIAVLGVHRMSALSRLPKQLIDAYFNTNKRLVAKVVLLRSKSTGLPGQTRRQRRSHALAKRRRGAGIWYGAQKHRFAQRPGGVGLKAFTESAFKQAYGSVLRAADGSFSNRHGEVSGLVRQFLRQRAGDGTEAAGIWVGLLTSKVNARSYIERHGDFYTYVFDVLASGLGRTLPDAARQLRLNIAGSELSFEDEDSDHESATRDFDAFDVLNGNAGLLWRTSRSLVYGGVVRSSMDFSEILNFWSPFGEFASRSRMVVSGPFVGYTFSPTAWRESLPLSGSLRVPGVFRSTVASFRFEDEEDFFSELADESDKSFESKTDESGVAFVHDMDEDQDEDDDDSDDHEDDADDDDDNIGNDYSEFLLAEDLTDDDDIANLDSELEDDYDFDLVVAGRGMAVLRRAVAPEWRFASEAGANLSVELAEDRLVEFLEVCDAVSNDGMAKFSRHRPAAQVAVAAENQKTADESVLFDEAGEEGEVAEQGDNPLTLVWYSPFRVLAYRALGNCRVLGTHFLTSPLAVNTPYVFYASGTPFGYFMKTSVFDDADVFAFDSGCRGVAGSEVLDINREDSNFLAAMQSSLVGESMDWRVSRDGLTFWLVLNPDAGFFNIVDDVGEMVDLHGSLGYGELDYYDDAFAGLVENEVGGVDRYFFDFEQAMVDSDASLQERGVAWVFESDDSEDVDQENQADQELDDLDVEVEGEDVMRDSDEEVLLRLSKWVPDELFKPLPTDSATVVPGQVPESGLDDLVAPQVTANEPATLFQKNWFGDQSELLESEVLLDSAWDEDLDEFEQNSVDAFSVANSDGEEVDRFFYSYGVAEDEDYDEAMFAPGFPLGDIAAVEDDEDVWFFVDDDIVEERDVGEDGGADDTFESDEDDFGDWVAENSEIVDDLIEPAWVGGFRRLLAQSRSWELHDEPFEALDFGKAGVWFTFVDVPVINDALGVDDELRDPVELVDEERLWRLQPDFGVDALLSLFGDSRVRLNYSFSRPVVECELLWVRCIDIRQVEFFGRGSSELLVWHFVVFDGVSSEIKPTPLFISLTGYSFNDLLCVLLASGLDLSTLLLCAAHLLNLGDEVELLRVLGLVVTRDGYASEYSYGSSELKSSADVPSRFWLARNELALLNVVQDLLPKCSTFDDLFFQVLVYKPVRLFGLSVEAVMMRELVTMAKFFSPVPDNRCQRRTARVALFLHHLFCLLDDCENRVTDLFVVRLLEALSMLTKLVGENLSFVKSVSFISLFSNSVSYSTLVGLVDLETATSLEVKKFRFISRLGEFDDFSLAAEVWTADVEFVAFFYTIMGGSWPRPPMLDYCRMTKMFGVLVCPNVAGLIGIARLGCPLVVSDADWYRSAVQNVVGLRKRLFNSELTGSWLSWFSISLALSPACFYRSAAVFYQQLFGLRPVLTKLLVFETRRLSVLHHAHIAEKRSELENYNSGVLEAENSRFLEFVDQYIASYRSWYARGFDAHRSLVEATCELLTSRDVGVLGDVEAVCREACRRIKVHEKRFVELYVSIYTASYARTGDRRLALGQASRKIMQSYGLANREAGRICRLARVVVFNNLRLEEKQKKNEERMARWRAGLVQRQAEVDAKLASETGPAAATLSKQAAVLNWFLSQSTVGLSRRVDSESTGNATAVVANPNRRQLVGAGSRITSAGAARELACVDALLVAATDLLNDVLGSGETGLVDWLVKLNADCDPGLGADTLKLINEDYSVQKLEPRLGVITREISDEMVLLHSLQAAMMAEERKEDLQSSCEKVMLSTKTKFAEKMELIGKLFTGEVLRFLCAQYRQDFTLVVDRWTGVGAEALAACRDGYLDMLSSRAAKTKFLIERDSTATTVLEEVEVDDESDDSSRVSLLEKIYVDLREEHRKKQDKVVFDIKLECLNDVTFISRCIKNDTEVVRLVGDEFMAPRLPNLKSVVRAVGGLFGNLGTDLNELPSFRLELRVNSLTALREVLGGRLNADLPTFDKTTSVPFRTLDIAVRREVMRLKDEQSRRDGSVGSILRNNDGQVTRRGAQSSFEFAVFNYESSFFSGSVSHFSGSSDLLAGPVGGILIFLVAGFMGFVSLLVM